MVHMAQFVTPPQPVSEPDRMLAFGMLAFGVIATIVGGLGASGALVASTAASGCDVMVNQVLGVSAALLGIVGVLHLIGPMRYLRSATKGRKSMVALCAFNAVVNLAIALFIVSQDMAVVSSAWWLLMVVNLFGIALFSAKRTQEQSG